MNLLGHFLRYAPDFPGRGRLTRWWLHRPRSSARQRCRLPGGAEIECDLTVPYEAMVWLGREEPNDLRMLQRLLRPGQTMVDCGANLGLWSLVAARSVAPTGRVIAFEPNPATFARLMAHVRANDLEGVVTAHPACCGSETSSVPFFCDAAHNISHVAANAAENTTLVPMTTLDAALGDAPVHALKIDVEGYELAVLQGAERLLRRCRPWICVEFNATLTPSDRLGDWDVHRHLRAAGYRCRPFERAIASDELNEAWRMQGYGNLYYWPA